MSGNSYSKNLWHLLLNTQSRRLAMFRQQYGERIQSPKVKHVERQRNIALSKLKIDAQTRRAALRGFHLEQRGQEAWEWKMFNYKRYQPETKQPAEGGAKGKAGMHMNYKKRTTKENNLLPRASFNGIAMHEY